MFKDPAGPIEAFDWGRFKIKGQFHSAEGEGVGKDIFMLGQDVRPWRERKGHRLKPAMVACALGKGITVLVIGNGVNGRIRVLDKTRKKIHSAGIETLIIKTTPEACRIYNERIRQGEPAALLAHGTC
jgi:hypothetical protein